MLRGYPSLMKPASDASSRYGRGRGFWIAIVLGVLLVTGGYRAYVSSPTMSMTRGETAESRAAVRALLRTYWKWQLLGEGFWENEMRWLAGRLRTQEERVAFFIEVLKRCDMQGGQFLEVTDILAEDWSAVKTGLDALIAAPDFIHVPGDQAGRMEEWALILGDAGRL